MARTRHAMDNEEQTRRAMIEARRSALANELVTGAITEEQTKLDNLRTLISQLEALLPETKTVAEVQIIACLKQIHSILEGPTVVTRARTPNPPNTPDNPERG